MDRVLIIEDDIDMAGLLRDTLETAGFDVAVARDGRAALELESRGCASVVLADFASQAALGEIVQDLREVSAYEAGGCPIPGPVYRAGAARGCRESGAVDDRDSPGAVIWRDCLP